MGEFGWAYISGSNISAAQGTDGSVQLREAGSTAFSGSTRLTFDANSNLQLTGSQHIQGHLSASVGITASAFYGDGSDLTALNASNISAGTLNNARLPSTISVTAITASTHVSASGFLGDGSALTGITSVSIANDGNNRLLTADGDGTMSAESNLTFDGSTMVLTGTLNVSGAINVNELNINVENRDVVNISVTGSTKFGDSSGDIHQFTGSILVNGQISSSVEVSASSFHGDGSNLTNVSSPLIIKEEGSNITTSASSINFVGAFVTASNSGDDVTVTVNAGGGSGGTIGAAEDEDGYSDGLFTDFTTDTAVGTPIDRFNEVLKILAPTPAPSVSRITSSVPSGVTAKLSFGSSKVVAGYTSSATAAGFDAVDATGIYSASVSGSNLRLGVYDGTQDITGEINHHVVESITNGYTAYSNDAFGNANEGTLKLELNGAVIHSVGLSGLAGSGNPNTGSTNSLTDQSGFTNVSITASSFDGNNSEWYIFKHRTAKFKIDTNQQKVGWNYARVIHSLASDNETNYIEWINDPSGAAGIANMSASNGRIEDVGLSGEKYLSGVKYNTGAVAKYKVDLVNLYSNVYAASGTPISFATSNSSVPGSQAVTDLGGGEDRTKTLGVTGSLAFNQTTLFNGTMSCNTTVTHPLKNTITNTGSAEANGFLLETRNLASTNLEEKFHDESFRKVSASYDTQGSVNAAAATWNSQTHMTGSNVDGHQDGLLFHNQRLYSPVDNDIPNGGDFKEMLNASGSSQPDYINDTPLGTRTFYRVVTNSSGVSKRDMKIVSTKNSTTYNNSSLGASNMHFFAKIPGSTGWMDISQNFTYGNTSDGDGGLISGASNDVDSGDNIHHITFGTQSVGNNEFIMIKAVADETWGGYINQLSFSVGATTNTTTNVGIELDNIDLDDTAGIDAKLSFGVNNVVAGYSNATGSSISLSNFNINSEYDDQGTTRRGVFKATEVMGGTLNENINANGNNYPANSFKDAFTGSLLLIVNGLTSSTIALDSLDAGNNLSSNTGFSLGAVGFSTTSDGIPDYTKPYRTGTYSIGTNQQNVGWNYARVVHRIGPTDTVTNYVEWVVDPSGSTDDTAISSPVLSDFGHTDLYYQSGIAYYAANPTASFDFSGSNFYRNVYATGSAISFPTTTNCTVTSIRTSGSGISTTTTAASTAPMALLNSSSNCHLTDIQVTGTLQYNGSTPSISGGLGLFTVNSVTTTGRILHPFKTDKTTNSATKSNLFVYSGSISHGTTNSGSNEDFNVEEYRIVSGNYANQESVTSSANTWNSQTHMNAANAHGDGMVTVNGFLISPLRIGVSGNTGDASLQVPAGNPDYSSLSEDTRSYYRYFKNTGDLTVQNFNLYVTGNASIVGKDPSKAHYGALGFNNRINIELKVPSDPAFTGDDDRSTAWSDAAIPQGGIDPTTDGFGVFNGGNGNLDQDASDGSNIAITLGTKEWKPNQLLVLKISAHKDWNGYLNSITASY